MKDSDLGNLYLNGEIICAEGEKGDAMYVIKSGKVKITKSTPAGNVKIATLDKGEIFGEMALFDKMPRAATAAALGDTRILSIDKEKLFSSINRDPTLVFKLLESMSKRIRGMNDELTKLKEDKADMLHFYVDIDETCNLVIEKAKQMISADNGSIMFIEGNGNTLYIKQAFGCEAEPKTKLCKGEGIAGSVMETGKAEMVNAVPSDPRFVQGAIDIKSIICAPLKCAGLIFGVMNLSNSAEKHFTEDDFKLLQTLSVYASIALQNARNFSQLNTAADRLIKQANIIDMC